MGRRTQSSASGWPSSASEARLALVAVASVVTAAFSTPTSSCPGTPEPLLWKATRGINATETVYLAATYALPYSSVQPLPDPVQEALDCADVAYFELACSMAPDGGMGSYFQHCRTYPISDEYDAVALRLSAQEVADVQDAFRNLLSQAPPTCTEAAAELKADIDQLTSKDFRTTLQTLYIMALHTMDPESCQLSGAKLAAIGMEDAMRSKFANKPIWGLRDVNMECSIYQGNTVDQDRALGQRLVTEFSNLAWLQNATAGQSAMKEVVLCGDLNQLAVLKQSMVHLPWLRTRMLSETNAVLAKAISTALGRNPGKTVLAVLEVQHFLNASADIVGQGVQTILAHNGFHVERVTGTLDCEPSELTGMGAKELGECVSPVFEDQVPSCNAFRNHFLTLLGNDTMYGRSTSKEACLECVNSTTTCTCKTVWANTSAYEALCTGTKVDGVHGVVMNMDLTRNPGSHRAGQSQAAKTVQSLFQYCYATSCNIQLQDEIALRQWYSRDESLTLGQVALHKPGERPRWTSGMHNDGVPSPFGGNSWSSWSWVLAVVLVAVCIAVLFFCFRLPKRKERRRKGGPLIGRKSSGGSGQYVRTPQYPGQVDEAYEELKPLASSASGPSTPQQMPAYTTEPMSQSGGWQQHHHQPEQDWQQQQMMQQHQMLQQQQMQMQQQQMLQQQQYMHQQPQQQMMQQPQFMHSARQQAAPTIDPSTSLKVYDSSLIAQALQMQEALGNAGAQAVQQMQMNSLHGMQQSLTQGLGSPGGSIGSFGMPPAPGSPFGSGVSLGLPASQPQSLMLQPGVPQASSMMMQPQAMQPQVMLPAQQSSMLLQQPQYYQQGQPLGMYGQPSSPSGGQLVGGMPAYAYQHQQPMVYRGY